MHVRLTPEFLGREMRIVLSTWGSTGDVQPFLGLSERLLKAGHEIRVCTSGIYRDRFAKRGLDFYEVGIPFDPDRFNHLMDEIIKIKNPLKSALFIAREGILFGAEKWYQDCLKAMVGYDLAVCHSGDIPGQEAAIRNNLPWLTVSYCPGYLKTAHEAPAPFPNLGTPLNSLLWKFVEWLMRKDVDRVFNDFITAVGGEERELIGLDGMYAPELNLIAASPNISKPPPDLPKKHRFTGPWFLDEPDYDPPPALQDFLDQGSSPVIITFGSMGGTKADETTKILVEAVKHCGQPAIIQTGWGNLGVAHPPEDILFVGYVPHHFLFRHGCCVVHHGGAGTTAAACRAGVPSIVISHLADQTYWGHTLRRLGVAPKPLYRRDMTAKRLAKRIDAVISSKSMMEKAKALGRKVDAEDGLTTAVKLIGEFAVNRKYRRWVAH